MASNWANTIHVSCWGRNFHEISKETYIYDKRDLCVLQKGPTHVTNIVSQVGTGWGKKVTVNTTGWRRPRGCLKLQVIFRKRAAHYRALRQKMTISDKAFFASLYHLFSVYQRPVVGWGTWALLRRYRALLRRYKALL